MLAECSTVGKCRSALPVCRVFVGTVATLSAKTELFRLKPSMWPSWTRRPRFWNRSFWDCCVPVLTADVDAIGKFILLGDHKQLPAVVLQSPAQSEVGDVGPCRPWGCIT